ncbi:1-acyl-sn-glycerol-3-phosphate acyltransferase [Wolbachia endosymbiont of Frankliniella intonsa]|nr:1-acyl-sn-glycerol-3-phosphate acyltransferase [Wolbachia endosymbiont of Frankliniella intonsa]WGJ62857.1 1-acyl-sn-glycerol-3-phosphate acyltransferase [Wolbachia endosymbiont of Frankliniella intonsa]
MHLMALKMYFINRSDGISSVLHIMKLAKVCIKKKRGIIIFPEGTRTTINQNIKYQSGIAALYSVILSIPVSY